MAEEKVWFLTAWNIIYGRNPAFRKLYTYDNSLKNVAMRQLALNITAVDGYCFVVPDAPGIQVTGFGQYLDAAPNNFPQEKILLIPSVQRKIFRGQLEIPKSVCAYLVDIVVDSPSLNARWDTLLIPPGLMKDITNFIPSHAPDAVTIHNNQAILVNVVDETTAERIAAGHIVKMTGISDKSGARRYPILNEDDMAYVTKVENAEPLQVSLTGRFSTYREMINKLIQEQSITLEDINKASPCNSE